MSRIAAIASIVLSALLAAYAAFGFWAVPAILQSQVRSLLAEELALEASFERVSFDPFGMRLDVEGFSVARPGQAPVGAIAVLHGDVEALELAAARLVFHEVLLDRPEVALSIAEDGSVELGGVALGGEPDPDGPSAVRNAEEDEKKSDAQAEGPGLLAELRVDSLLVRNGAFHLRDESREPELTRELAPVNLHAHDLDLTDLMESTGRLQQSRLELVLGLADGASLTAAGSLDVDPPTVDLDVTLVGVPLQVLQPYLAAAARLVVHDGVLGASGKLRLDGESPLRFQGQAGVDDLRLYLEDVDEPSLSWDRLELREIDVGGNPLGVTLGAVEVREPRARLVLGPDGLDLANAVAPDAGEGKDVAGSETETATTPIVVGPIRLSSGYLRFEDHRVEPHYAIELHELAVAVDGFRNDPASRSRADLSAQVDDYAPIRLEGTLTPLAPRSFFDMRFALDALELASLSPYTGRYLGRTIDAGRGTVEVDMKVLDHQLDSSTRVTLDALEFGDGVESEEATSLPVASAASLAKDADGRIFFEVPIEGNLEEPGFRYTSALVDACEAMVTRAVSTPYHLVGGLISAGGELFSPEEMSEIGFAPGSDELAGSERVKVDAIAVALLESPDIELQIQGAAAQKLDGSENLGALARKRARVIRRQIEDAGVDGERVVERNVEIDDARVREGGRVVSHVELR